MLGTRYGNKDVMHSPKNESQRAAERFLWKHSLED